MVVVSERVESGGRRGQTSLLEGTSDPRREAIPGVRTRGRGFSRLPGTTRDEVSGYGLHNFT